MKKNYKIVAVIIFISFLFFNNSLFSKNISDEIKYVSSEADIYAYINLKLLNGFLKKNGVNPQDAFLLIDQKKENPSEAAEVFNRMSRHIEEIFIIGQTEKLQQGSGLLVLIKVDKSLKELSKVLLKKKKESVKGGSIYEFNGEKGVFITALDNVYVIGFKPYLISFLAARNSKKPLKNDVLNNVIINSKNKTMYLYVPMSKYIKNQMKGVIQKGDQMSRGLSSNPFVKAILSLNSYELSLKTDDSVKIYNEIKSGNAADGEKLMMLSHFTIVGASLAMSFADTISRFSGRPNLSATDEKVKKAQALISRIRTKQTGMGVLLSFQLSNDENKEIIAALKKAIDAKKAELKQAESEKKINELFALIKDGKLKEVESRIKSLGNINIKNKKGETPVYIASKFGKKEIAAFLIKKGADINIKTGPELLTPLHASAVRGHSDVIELLLNNKAGINEKDSSGNTPFHSALKAGYLQIARLLIVNGADVKIDDDNGETTLDSAVKADDIMMVKMIIERGVDVNASSKNGFTALHYAAVKGNMLIYNLLIEKGAGVNARTNSGETPLHFAAENGHMDIVKSLIKSGADVNIQDSDGNTPAYRAKIKGFYDISEFIEKSGKQ